MNSKIRLRRMVKFRCNFHIKSGIKKSIFSHMRLERSDLRFELFYSLHDIIYRVGRKRAVTKDFGTSIFWAWYKLSEKTRKQIEKSVN